MPVVGKYSQRVYYSGNGEKESLVSHKHETGCGSNITRYQFFRQLGRKRTKPYLYLGVGFGQTKFLGSLPTI